MSHTRPPGPEYRTGEPYLEPGRAPINTLWAADDRLTCDLARFLGARPGLRRAPVNRASGPATGEAARAWVTATGYGRGSGPTSVSGISGPTPFGLS